MKCYVINLASAAGRLAHMRNVFGSAGIPFERFDAINGRFVQHHPALDLLPLRTRLQLTPGETGCFLSHYELWRTISSGSEPFAAIFEDDLLIDPRLGAVLAKPALPPDADLVKLETANVKTLLSRESIPGPGGVTYRRLLTQHIGTGAYIVSNVAAQRLVDLCTHLDRPIDLAVFNPEHRIGRRFKIYQVLPGLAVQSLYAAPHLKKVALVSGLSSERRARRRAKQRVALVSGHSSERRAKPVHRVRKQILRLFKTPVRALYYIRRRILGTRLIVPFEA